MSIFFSFDQVNSSIPRNFHTSCLLRALNKSQITYLDSFMKNLQNSKLENYCTSESASVVQYFLNPFSNICQLQLLKMGIRLFKKNKRYIYCLNIILSRKLIFEKLLHDHNCHVYIES